MNKKGMAHFSYQELKVITFRTCDLPLPPCSHPVVDKKKYIIIIIIIIMIINEIKNKI